MSRGQSQTRTDSRRRALGKCKCKSNTESVVIIDVDNNNDVFIINSLENSHHVPTSRSPWKNTSPDDVISIDDDDDDDDDEGFDDNPTSANHASTSKPSNPMFNSASFSKGLDDEDDDDDCQMYVKDGNYSAKLLPKYGNPRNRYGLDFVPDSRSSGGSTSESSTSEMESSGHDSSDCEIMDDTSGEIRENWERAALRKRMSEGVQISSENSTSFSGSTSDLGTQSHETTTNNFNEENCCLNQTYADHYQEMPAECSPCNSYNIQNNLSSDEPMEDFLFCATNLDPFTEISHNEPVFQKEEVIPEKCSSQSHPPDINQFNGRGACSHEPSVQTDTGHVNFPEKMEEIFPVSSCHSQLPHDFVDSPTSAAREREKSFMSEKAWPNNQQTEESRLNNNCFQTSMQETFGNHYAGSRGERSCSSNAEPEDKSQVQNGLVIQSEKPGGLTGNDNTFDVLNGLITDREKHKESAEFRRAAEEEWASRQRQLQIQAEEVQRLRRRRKAESLRLLDMEKRQKQRLEEIRESQKKDEETINLKEQIRVEVRKELEIMELRCKDMASVLRGLGIHVEGGLFPLSHEINSACKQALRKFHPDRFSRSDIRQQVKAEETFKFISRLKEKLLPFS